MKRFLIAGLLLSGCGIGSGVGVQFVDAGADSGSLDASIDSPEDHNYSYNDAGLDSPEDSISDAVAPYDAYVGYDIKYHGGPVITGGVHIYLIWYGNWQTDAGNAVASNIIPNFISNLGGSPYFNIETTYYQYSPDGGFDYVANAVQLCGQIYDNYSQGSTISDALVQSIVKSNIDNGVGTFPLDPNGVYAVITSADIYPFGFCSDFCAYHQYITGTNIRYILVGDPSNCLGSCSPLGIFDYSRDAGPPIAPNGNWGADSMVNSLAHEINESVTDPYLNAWFTDNGGAENSDLCSWTYGQTFTTLNKGVANMTLGGINYLVQQNWVNSFGGYCAIKYPN